MTSNPKLIHIEPGQGDAFSAAGDVYRVLASGDQTGGVYALSEIRVSPGNGPPPHVHCRDDEAFFVLEGEITFQVGDQNMLGRPGCFVQAPRNIPHAFKNNGKSPARMLVFVTPSGFENFVKEFARRLPSFDSPAIPMDQHDLEKLLATAPQYGIQIVPLPAARPR
jgi:quercetin dioxygenase-like cupin family protein